MSCWRLADPGPKSLVVIGCSTSEVGGEKIGTHSNMEIAEAIYQGIAPVLSEKGLYLAAQCCEHLNRSVIIEEEAALYYGLEAVNVMPQMKAGGSFATTAYTHFDHPVAVEEVKAVLRDRYRRNLDRNAPEAGSGAGSAFCTTDRGGSDYLCQDKTEVYRRGAGAL